MRFVSRGLPLLCVVALAACGGSALEPSGPAYVNEADLAIMVLPQEELGALGEGLEVAAEESGWTSHREAANDTFDPYDSAATLTARGRVAGYELAYEDPKMRRRGLVLVRTGVELLRDEIYASGSLDKRVADFESHEGLARSGVKLARVALFDVPGVGDESAGLRAVLDGDGRKVRVTLAFFRRGRVLGVAVVSTADKRGIADEVRGLAKALDLRIQAVLAGKIQADPVPLTPS